MPEAVAQLSVSGVAQTTTGERILQEPNRRITLDTLLRGEGHLAAGVQSAVQGATIDGAYLHIPFCFHKCHYCDFYSIVDNQDRQGVFIDRLIGEIEAVAPRIIRPLQTIFVGGGTPTLLETHLWRRLLPVIGSCLPLIEDGEFTVEANPETVTAELAGVLVEGGVNRISIGAQSFNHRHLKMLERWHEPQNVARSMEILRAAGISNINLDLIFAIPGQTLDDWLADLDAALALEPTHISCYGLMYEHNTPLTRRMQMGQIQPIDQDLEAAMYEATIDRMADAGFEHYEISNWGRVRAHCRHNLLYWRNANWWAFGPSASGHVNGLRWKNVPRLGDYLDTEDRDLPPVIDVEMVDEPTRAGEQFMLGLRLIEGLAVSEIDRLLSISGEREEPRRAAIQRHLDAGLLQVADNRLCLTRRGLLLANDVLVDLV